MAKPTPLRTMLEMGPTSTFSTARPRGHRRFRTLPSASQTRRFHHNLQIAFTSFFASLFALGPGRLLEDQLCLHSVHPLSTFRLSEKPYFSGRVGSRCNRVSPVLLLSILLAFICSSAVIALAREFNRDQRLQQSKVFPLPDLYCTQSRLLLSRRGFCKTVVTCLSFLALIYLAVHFLRSSRGHPGQSEFSSVRARHNQKYYQPSMRVNLRILVAFFVAPLFSIQVPFPNEIGHYVSIASKIGETRKMDGRNNAKDGIYQPTRDRVAQDEANTSEEYAKRYEERALALGWVAEAERTRIRTYIPELDSLDSRDQQGTQIRRYEDLDHSSKNNHDFGARSSSLNNPASQFQLPNRNSAPSEPNFWEPFGGPTSSDSAKTPIRKARSNVFKKLSDQEDTDVPAVPKALKKAKSSIFRKSPDQEDTDVPAVPKALKKAKSSIFRKSPDQEDTDVPAVPKALKKAKSSNFRKSPDLEDSDIPSMPKESLVSRVANSLFQSKVNKKAHVSALTGRTISSPMPQGPTGVRVVRDLAMEKAAREMGFSLPTDNRFGLTETVVGDHALPIENMEEVSLPSEIEAGQTIPGNKFDYHMEDNVCFRHGASKSMLAKPESRDRGPPMDNTEIDLFTAETLNGLEIVDGESDYYTEEELVDELVDLKEGSNKSTLTVQESKDGGLPMENMKQALLTAETPTGPEILDDGSDHRIEDDLIDLWEGVTELTSENLRPTDPDLIIESSKEVSSSRGTVADQSLLDSESDNYSEDVFTAPRQYVIKSTSWDQWPHTPSKVDQSPRSASEDRSDSVNYSQHRMDHFESFFTPTKSSDTSSCTSISSLGTFECFGTATEVTIKSYSLRPPPIMGDLVKYEEDKTIRRPGIIKNNRQAAFSGQIDMGGPFQEDDKVHDSSAVRSPRRVTFDPVMTGAGPTQEYDEAQERRLTEVKRRAVYEPIMDSSGLSQEDGKIEMGGAAEVNPAASESATDNGETSQTPTKSTRTRDPNRSHRRGSSRRRSSHRKPKAQEGGILKTLKWTTEPSAEALEQYRQQTFARLKTHQKDPDLAAKLKVSSKKMPPEAPKPTSKEPPPPRKMSSKGSIKRIGSKSSGSSSSKGQSKASLSPNSPSFQLNAASPSSQLKFSFPSAQLKVPSPTFQSKDALQTSLGEKYAGGSKLAGKAPVVSMDKDKFLSLSKDSALPAGRHGHSRSKGILTGEQTDLDIALANLDLHESPQKKHAAIASGWDNMGVSKERSREEVSEPKVKEKFYDRPTGARRVTKAEFNSLVGSAIREPTPTFSGYHQGEALRIPDPPSRPPPACPWEEEPIQAPAPTTLQRLALNDAQSESKSGAPNTESDGKDGKKRGFKGLFTRK